MVRMNRLSLAAGILVVTLAASPAHAAGAPSAGMSGWWTWIATWAQSFLGMPVETDPAHIGPHIDPNGPGEASSATGQADIGPRIDPNGGNAASSDPAQTDSGPRIDPNGNH